MQGACDDIMNKEARARWRDFEDSKSLARIYKKNKKQGDRFMDFVNEQYRNRIVPGNIAHINNVGGLPKDVYSAAGKVLSKNKGTDDYIRKGISNYGRPAQLPAVISRKAAQKAAQSATQNAAQKATQNATQSATQNAAQKATNVATEAAKKGGKLGRGIAALAGLAMISGTAYGAHKYRQNRARQQEQEEKVASIILEDLADIKSRYEAYEKEADENMMEEMSKEARARWRDFEDLDDYVYEKEAASVGETFKNMANSKAFKRVAPILNDTWRGAAAGAMTGAAGGALSEYKDKGDNKVHRLKNALHGMKNGAIMGGVGGAAYGTWKDKDHAIGRYNSKGYKKRASEDLDGLYKQALNATMVGGAIGGYDSLKGIGRQFMKGFKGNEGNFIKNVGAGIKNVGLKGIEKGIGKTVAGAAIGAGIDGISNGLKKQDPNNPYQ